MADNDAEIDIGVSLDETQFKSSFNNFLRSLKSETAVALEDALNHVKGSAAKNWGTLPYSTMHQPSTGAASASQLFVPGFAQDLKDLGIRKGSAEYTAALMSATYRSSVPDPLHRQNLLQSYGRNAPRPDSAIERVLSTDYSLLSQPWSREFVKVRTHKGFSTEELQNKKVAELKELAGQYGVESKSNWRKADYIASLVEETNKPTTHVDFAGMREYAVEHGLGKWTDKEHTAKNFELINDELEKISENSEKSAKDFSGWNDNLKSVLGTLTAIGGLTTALGSAVVTGTKKSIEGTERAAGTLERRRAFVGMSALDELSAQSASRAVGLGKDAITSEIINLSGSREQYKLLGQGLDALYPSLAGTFDNLMTIENPMDMYKSILTEVYGAMRGADETTRARTLMLLENQKLDAASQVIGSLLSNESLAKSLNYDPTKLFELKSNPFYGAYADAEAMLPDLTKLKESINASYTELFNTWTDAFGEPFMGWWDKFLQNKVVPIFGDIVGGVRNTLFPDTEEQKHQEFTTALGKTLETMQELNSVANVEDDTVLWVRSSQKATEGRSTVVQMPEGALKDRAGWWDFAKLGISPNDLASSALNTDTEPKKFMRALESIANPESYNKGALEDETTRDIMWRAQAAVNWLKRTGYYNDLAESSVIGSEKNTATMNVVRAYINGEILAGQEASTPTNVLDTYLVETMLQSPGWQAMEEFFDKWGAYLNENPERATEIELKFTGEMAPYIEARIQGNANVVTNRQ